MRTGGRRRRRVSASCRRAVCAWAHRYRPPSYRERAQDPSQLRLPHTRTAHRKRGSREAQKGLSRGQVRHKVRTLRALSPSPPPLGGDRGDNGMSMTKPLQDPVERRAPALRVGVRMSDRVLARGPGTPSRFGHLGERTAFGIVARVRPPGAPPTTAQEQSQYRIPKQSFDSLCVSPQAKCGRGPVRKSVERRLRMSYGAAELAFCRFVSRMTQAADSIRAAQNRELSGPRFPRELSPRPHGGAPDD